MISEAVQLLSDPFLARRDEAEDLFDHRFKEAEIDCRHCEGWGSTLEDAMEVYKCNAPGCRSGSIYTLLCSRCSLSENDCQCNVEDFLR